jgi:effector-binding domain-containing protein
MGLVWWQEVLDDVTQKMDSCCAGGQASPIDTHVEIFNIPHCKVMCLIWSDWNLSFP